MVVEAGIGEVANTPCEEEVEETCFTSKIVEVLKVDIESLWGREGGLLFGVLEALSGAWCSSEGF